MPTIGDEMTVTIKFDREIDAPQGSFFTALLAARIIIGAEGSP